MCICKQLSVYQSIGLSLPPSPTFFINTYIDWTGSVILVLKLRKFFPFLVKALTSDPVLTNILSFCPPIWPASTRRVTFWGQCALNTLWKTRNTKPNNSDAMYKKCKIIIIKKELNHTYTYKYAIICIITIYFQSFQLFLILKMNVANTNYLTYNVMFKNDLTQYLLLSDLCCHDSSDLQHSTYYCLTYVVMIQVT